MAGAPVLLSILMLCCPAFCVSPVPSLQILLLGLPPGLAPEPAVQLSSVCSSEVAQWCDVHF